MPNHLAFLEEALRGVDPQVPDTAVTFAVAVHTGLHDEECRAAFLALMRAVGFAPIGKNDALREMILAAPSLLDATRFQPPFGVQDLPAVLAACFWMHIDWDDICPDATHEDWATVHARLMCTFHALLESLHTHAQTRLSLEEGTQTRQAFIEHEINDLGDPTFVEPEFFKTLHDVSLTPTAMIAVLGVQPMAAIRKTATGKRLRWLVANCNRALAARFAHGTANSKSAQVLQHLRHFLDDAADRLRRLIIAGDRVPYVMASQRLLLEAMRAYVNSLVGVVCCECKFVAPGAATVAVLVALVNGRSTEQQAEGRGHRGGDAWREHPPLQTLLDTDVTMLEGHLGGQDKTYWAVLRVILSGSAHDEARIIAKQLLETERKQPGVGAAAAMLCALMHTRMGMLVLAFSNDEGRTFPVADMATYMASAAHGASLLDLALGSCSGTHDLVAMASPPKAIGDAEALARAHHEALALTTGDAAALTLARDGGGKHDEDDEAVHVTRSFLAALRHVARSWIREFDHGGAWPSPCTVPALRVFSEKEALCCLQRTAAASPKLHCDMWCAHAFGIAQELEMQQHHRGAPALFIGCSEGAPWARLHLRWQVERALHAARDSGKLGIGVVICAWVFSANTARYFARPVGSQIFGLEANERQGGGVATRRAENAISDCALAFERALHERNLDAQLTRARTGNGVAGGYTDDRPECTARSSARTRALQLSMESVALGSGSTCCLDKASEVAIDALRQQNLAGTTKIYGTAGPAAHGAAVAILGRAAPPRSPTRLARLDATVGPPPDTSKLYELLQQYTRGHFCKQR
jgi:hypothetical protein